MKNHKVIEQFTKYLATLRYSKIVCYNYPNQVSLFLQHTDVTISRLRTKHFVEFINHISTTKSKRTKRQLSNVQINGYINSLKHFTKFLYHMYNIEINSSHLTYLKVNTQEKLFLSQQEIKQLFDVCTHCKLGMRDQVMLVLYYSCGLRRNEGVNVLIEDIDFNNNVLFVRKGKNGKQRYVPFTQNSHDILRNYINVGRRRLNRKHKLRKTLLINYRGEKIQSRSLLLRLKTLCNRANINENVGLHTLRHSIATHLLHNKMDIYDISQFLGHSSLEATQIYTHISKDSVKNQ